MDRSIERQAQQEDRAMPIRTLLHRTPISAFTIAIAVIATLPLPARTIAQSAPIVVGAERGATCVAGAPQSLRPGGIAMLAGAAIPAFSGDRVPALQAGLGAVSGMAVAPSGDLYLNGPGDIVRRIDARTGRIATIYKGLGLLMAQVIGFSDATTLFYTTGTDIVRLNVTTAATGTVPGKGGQIDNFNRTSVSIDSHGALYLSIAQSAIRRVDSTSGISTTVAGNLYDQGSSGDGGPAAAATLTWPLATAIAADGTLYIGQIDGAIRKVTPDGTISTLTKAISGQIVRLVARPNGDLYVWVTSQHAGGVPPIDIIHAGTSTLTPIPVRAPARDVAVAPDGMFYVLSEYNYDPGMGPVQPAIISRVDPRTGRSVPYAGNARAGVGVLYASSLAPDGACGLYMLTYPAAYHLAPGMARPVSFTLPGQPAQIATDARGDLYEADPSTNSVVRVDRRGHLLATIIRNLSNSPDGYGPYSGAHGAAAGPMGAAVRADTPAAIPDIRPHGGGGGYSSPSGVAVDARGDVFALTSASATVTALFINGVRKSFSTGNHSFDPTDIAAGPAGSVYLSDNSNNMIRRLDTRTGTLTTVAGTGVAGFGGDGGLARWAEMNAPAGMAVDGMGNLFIADQGNDVVRRVDARTGRIVTVAGVSGHSGFNGVSRGARGSYLQGPDAVAIDNSGHLYVADSGGTVRVVYLPSNEE